jgi:hypothetical protein
MITLFISNEKCKYCYGKGFITEYHPNNKQRLNMPCICLRPATNIQIEDIYNQIQESYMQQTITPSQVKEGE